MRKIWRPIITLILLTLCSAPSHAVPLNVFRLRNIQQSADLFYEYDRSQYESSDANVRQRLFEGYNFFTEYAVIDPDLLNGKLKTRVVFHQYDYSDGDTDTQSLSNFDIFFDIRGIIKDKSTYPLSFFSSSSKEDVSPNFGGGYSIYTQINGLNWQLKNDTLPASIGYTRSSSKTDGLSKENEQVVNTFTASVYHNKGISNSELNFWQETEEFFYDDSQGDESSETDRILFKNRLNWASDSKQRTLNSRVRAEQTNGIYEQSILEWEESLDWDLGKALESNLVYSYLKNDVDQSDTERNTGRAWLRHELFKSLKTTLQGRVSDYQYNSGNETQYGGRVSLDYTKVLPAASMLNITLYRDYNIVDRNLDDDTLVIFDEAHTVVFGEPLFLNLPNVVVASIVVRNADPLVRPTPYEPDVDYRVEQAGVSTEIVVAGPGLSNDINEGDVLDISYDIFVDPQLKFAYDTYGIKTVAHLFSDQHRIYASYDESTPKILDEGDTPLFLVSSKTYRVGAESDLGRGYSLTGEYSLYQSDDSESQNLQSEIRYHKVWGSTRVSLYLKDRQQWFEPSGDSYNTLSMGGSYRRQLANSAMFFTQVSYDRSMSGSRDFQRLFTGANLQWILGRIELSVRAQAGFREFDGISSNEERFWLDLTRYF